MYAGRKWWGCVRYSEPPFFLDVLICQSIFSLRYIASMTHTSRFRRKWGWLLLIPSAHRWISLATLENFMTMWPRGDLKNCKSKSLLCVNLQSQSGNQAPAQCGQFVATHGSECCPCISNPANNLRPIANSDAQYSQTNGEPRAACGAWTNTERIRVYF